MLGEDQEEIGGSMIFKEYFRAFRAVVSNVGINIEYVEISFHLKSMIWMNNY